MGTVLSGGVSLICIFLTHFGLIISIVMPGLSFPLCSVSSVFHTSLRFPFPGAGHFLRFD